MPLLVLALWLMGCASTPPPPAPTPPEKASQKAPVMAEERDLLLLDLLYQKNAKKSLPLVVFIHGSEHSFYMANKVIF
jgi:hypothetical protein